MKTNTSVILLNAFPDKKIKSLGNKILLDIKKDYKIIDYQIDMLNKIYSNPEIIIVGGFENKRVKKYLSKLQTHNIKYIDHELDNSLNIGHSIVVAMDLVSKPNLVIVNSSILLRGKVIDQLKKTKKSFILAQHNVVGSVGCRTDANQMAQHCFYGLKDKIFDFVYLDSSNVSILKKCLKTSPNVSRFFLFEILNGCLDLGADLRLLYIEEKDILSIDNTEGVRLLKKRFKTQQL